jgi:hypothetical protein
MIMFNCVIAMLHNTKLNRWHPILFSENPLPGPSEPGKIVRHKSAGHHTEGFATQAEANADAEKLAIRVRETSGDGACRLMLDRVYEWDGTDVPAMVEFFGEREGVPA